LNTNHLQEHLPAVLLRPGPRELLWWQWLALPFVLVLSWTLGRILVHLADASPAEAQGRGQSRAGAEADRGA
jgi:MscS family membrane protein